MNFSDWNYAIACAWWSKVDTTDVNGGTRDRKVLHFHVAVNVAIDIRIRGMAILESSGTLW